jgi:pimeloyl-ACP methyl ester carboxylesterase
VRLLQIIVSSSLVLLALAGCGAQKGLSPDQQARLAAGTRVDIGEVSLYIQCRGTGSPTIVLEAGLHGDSSSWLQVAPPLSRRTRVCGYDRAAMGRSGKFENYRGPGSERVVSSEDVARNLHLLLEKARVPGPYLLVAHSLGGWFVRSYQVEYPGEVAGMVLIDAVDIDAEMYTNIPGLFQIAPGVNMLLSLSRAHQRKARFGSMPLAVLEAGLGSDLFWRAGQESQARSSSNSILATALRSDHGIIWNQAPLAIHVIEQVLEAVRSGRPMACDGSDRTLGGRCRTF